MAELGIDILKRKVNSLINEGRQAFYDVVDSETAKEGSRGFSMPTGALIFRIAQLSAERIKVISQNTISTISELKDKNIIEVNSNTKQIVSEIVMQEITNEAKQIAEHAKSLASKVPHGNMAFGVIKEAIIRAKNDLEIELDVMSLENSKEGNKSVFTVYNYGTVNSIQSGHNKSINHLNTNKENELAVAICNLLEQIKTHDNGAVSKDLIQTIEDTLVELKCPEKNDFKIQSYLMMTMTTLQTLPALKPAVFSLATAYDFYFGTNIAAQLI